MHFKAKIEIDLGLNKCALKTYKKLILFEPNEAQIFLDFCELLLRNHKNLKCIKYSEIGKNKFIKFENEFNMNLLQSFVYLEEIQKAQEILQIVFLKDSRK